MLEFIVIASLVIAITITFLNGMNDAANAISTVIVTRVLTPIKAVIWAAFWEFMAFFIFKVTVAEMIGGGIVQHGYMNPYIIFSALIGAVIWVWLCTHYGMPISTSQALVGGMIGAVWFVHGMDALIMSNIIWIFAFIVIAPLAGIIVGFFIMCLVLFICKNVKRKKVENVFKRLQLISSAAFSLGHGANDAQKTMGIIALTMLIAMQTTDISETLNNVIGFIYDGEKGFYIPNSLAILCYVIISAGILVGGKKVIKTMGKDIARMDNAKGFCAETSGAITLIISTILGMPVSSSHTMTGSIIGVGLTDGVKSVKWVTAKKIIWTWFMTILAPMVISGLIYMLIYNTCLK